MRYATVCSCKECGDRNDCCDKHVFVRMQCSKFFHLFVCKCLRVFKAQDGCTALISAAGDGHIECVRLLIEAGANKEAKDKVRVTRVCQFEMQWRAGFSYTISSCFTSHLRKAHALISFICLNFRVCRCSVCTERRNCTDVGRVVWSY